MEVLNEILQWTAIIYALWAIWQLGNATRSNIDSYNLCSLGYMAIRKCNKEQYRFFGNGSEMA